MLKISRFALILLALAPALHAQAVLPKANVYFGYSYNHFNVGQGFVIPSSSSNINGYEFSGEGQVLPFLGIVGDISSYYGHASGIGPLCPAPACSGIGSYSIREQNYLFGPRVSVTVGKFTPFAHGLVGIGHTSSGITSDTSFATALGGGADYKLSGPLAWRFQADYLHTRFFSSHQNNVRLSTGIVFRF